jgi:glucose/arabinose dehydrogenase
MRARVLRLAGAATLAFACLAASASSVLAAPAPVAAGGGAAQLVGGGLVTPTSFAFSGTTMFVGDGGHEQTLSGGGVYVLRRGTAVRLPGSPPYVAGVAWHNGSLYISGGRLSGNGNIWRLYRWSGWNGKRFAHQRVIYTAPARFDGFNGLAFGADGRLYVGVDVGYTDGNDHGPASTSPYLYDILSFTTKGTGLKVFSSGMRQPWQLAFPAHSNSPFVSVLGQDGGGVVNPPDFVLRVSAGQDYGFPDCTQLVAAACVGFANPFQLFSGHTDPMGLAVGGGRLYISEFGAQLPAQVVSMPLGGGQPQTVLSGFAAPIVGLGINAGYLYVGELTGRVFRLKL